MWTSHSIASSNDTARDVPGAKRDVGHTLPTRLARLIAAANASTRAADLPAPAAPRDTRESIAIDPGPTRALIA